MRAIFSCLLAAPLFLALAGCKPASEAKKAEGPLTEEAQIQANLAKLSPEDRTVAEAQRFCAIEDENRLGAMGPPIKVMVKDEPVFLCCKSCQKKALADPDKTLAKVKDLKAKAAAPGS
jgi:hypothetical protein